MSHSTVILGMQAAWSRSAMKTAWYLIGLFQLVLCSTAAPADAARQSDRIVAIVNSDVITLSEIKEEIGEEKERLSDQYEGAELAHRVQQLQHAALTRLIERRLQMQLAKEKGLEITDAELEVALQRYQQQGVAIPNGDEEAIERIREQLTVMKVVEREVRGNVMITEDEIKGFYEDNISEFMLPEEYRLSQIFVRPRSGEGMDSAQTRAQRLYTALKNGADFSELATERSDGAEAVHGGNLGFVHEGELEPQLEEAIAPLQPEEITQPIRTENGFHILRLEERRPPEYRPYAQVKTDVERLLYNMKTAEQYHEWMKALKEKAYIDVKF